VSQYFASGFFHESSPSKPLKIPLESFPTFSKFLGDIDKSRCTIGVNYTGGKFAIGINDTDSKFFHKYHCMVSLVPVTNLLLVSTTPAVNLPPLSTTQVENNGKNI
jgi:hypothetical protein